MGLRRRSFAFQSSSPSVEISSPVRIQSVGITGGGEGPSVGGTSDAAEAADANAAALDDEARRKVEIDMLARLLLQPLPLPEASIV